MLLTFSTLYIQVNLHCHKPCSKSIQNLSSRFKKLFYSAQMKEGTTSLMNESQSTGSLEDIITQKKRRRSNPSEDNSSQVKVVQEEDGEYRPSTGDGEDDNDEHDSTTGDDDDGKKELEEPLKRHTTHGFHLVRGKMDHGMEDFLVAENRKIDGHELGLYAIFDGHSGRAVAEYLQSHLFNYILSKTDFWKSPKKAIKKVYKDTNDEILEKVVGSRGGSTAVTAILIDRQKLIVANVGDSRAVLCRNGKAKAITVDHEPEKEKDLVESRGGFVAKKPGNVPRVDGQLAMTRAFGDGKVKEHITSEPDVSVVMIDDDVDFMILASDGLWKVMLNQDALDCIKEMEDAQEASEELIKEALSRKSPDDISCVVVMFH